MPTTLLRATDGAPAHGWWDARCRTPRPARSTEEPPIDGEPLSAHRALPGAFDDGEVVYGAGHLDLAPDPRSASAARRFVTCAAPELPDDVLETLQLLTSEVVTNAVLHARTRLEVGVLVSDDAVVVAVHDLDLVTPLQQPYPDREGGWGLVMVAALSERWDTAHHGRGGKTTWFRLSRTCARAAADGAAARHETTDRPS